MAERGMPPTQFRYIDWVLTTPTMLVSLAAVAAYWNDTGETTLRDLFGGAAGCALLNAMCADIVMLAFGWVGLGIRNSGLQKKCVAAGFVPFVQIWVNMGVGFIGGLGSLAAIILTAIVWLVYGVVKLAAPVRWYDGWFNILDTISKNVFSLVLSLVSF